MFNKSSLETEQLGYLLHETRKVKKGKKIMKIVRSLLKNLANANPNIWGYVTL